MNADQIASLLKNAMGVEVEADLAGKLERYLDLLQRWNVRTNLTSIRGEEKIVMRHFGESLECARMLPSGLQTLLDFGSGAGFPGAICALARREIAVTLAEAQSKKAAFLMELCRSVPVAARVHAGRVEHLPPRARFDAVTLRAVDRMEDAAEAALKRLACNGWLVLMTSDNRKQSVAGCLNRVEWSDPLRLQGTRSSIILLGRLRAC